MIRQHLGDLQFHQLWRAEDFAKRRAELRVPDYHDLRTFLDDPDRDTLVDDMKRALVKRSIDAPSRRVAPMPDSMHISEVVARAAELQATFDARGSEGHLCREFSPQIVAIILCMLMNPASVPVCITLYSDVPIGSGLGSSAAYCCALATGLFNLAAKTHGAAASAAGGASSGAFPSNSAPPAAAKVYAASRPFPELPLAVPLSPPAASASSAAQTAALDTATINEFAYQGERVLHGTVSGLDNTCVTYGGILVYRRNVPTLAEQTLLCLNPAAPPGDLKRLLFESRPRGPNIMHFLPSGCFPDAIEVLITDTGVLKNTQAQVAHVAEQRRKHPQLVTSYFLGMEQMVTRIVSAIGLYCRLVGRELPGFKMDATDAASTADCTAPAVLPASAYDVAVFYERVKLALRKTTLRLRWLQRRLVAAAAKEEADPSLLASHHSSSGSEDGDGEGDGEDYDDYYGDDDDDDAGADAEGTETDDGFVQHHARLASNAGTVNGAAAMLKDILTVTKDGPGARVKRPAAPTAVADVPVAATATAVMSADGMAPTVDDEGLTLVEYSYVPTPVLLRRLVALLAHRNQQIAHVFFEFIGPVIADNNILLARTLGVGHDMLDAACRATARGMPSKLTGAGGGGCAFSLIPPRSLATTRAAERAAARAAARAVCLTATGKTSAAAHAAAAAAAAAAPIPPPGAVPSSQSLPPSGRGVHFKISPDSPSRAVASRPESPRPGSSAPSSRATASTLPPPSRASTGDATADAASGAADMASSAAGASTSGGTSLRRSPLSMIGLALHASPSTTSISSLASATPSAESGLTGGVGAPLTLMVSPSLAYEPRATAGSVAGAVIAGVAGAPKSASGSSLPRCVSADPRVQAVSPGATSPASSPSPTVNLPVDAGASAGRVLASVAGAPVAAPLSCSPSDGEGPRSPAGGAHRTPATPQGAVFAVRTAIAEDERDRLVAEHEREMARVSERVRCYRVKIGQAGVRVHDMDEYAEIQRYIAHRDAAAAARRVH
jgi:mevalonate kinase